MERKEMEKRRDMGEKTGIVIAGAAILDVVAVSVGPEVFLTGSSPTDGIRLSTGGDALNEATVLAHLARSMDAGSLQVSLLTALGDDMAGRLILRHCGECGISVGEGAVRKKMDTGINVVLVQKGGERNFLTDPNGSLRRLSKEDILAQLPQKADIFCMASIFVSPLLGEEELEELFGECKRRGMLVCADMTRPKNGETVEAMGKALRCLDVLFANEAEAAALTGEADVKRAAEALYRAGVSCAVIKRGGKGCFLRDRSHRISVPAFPAKNCMDTTGAGDSFAAGFLFALSKGRGAVECARFANRCGARAVGTAGATEWTKEGTPPLFI